MPLKNILVHVDNSAQAAGTIAAACGLARAHNAHLTGLTVEHPPQVPGYAAIELPTSALDVIKAQQAESIAQARAIFEKTVEKTGLSSQSGWSLAKGFTLETLALRSRYADLTVIAQENAATSTTDPGLVDDLVMTSGRPVLVIPYIGAPPNIGRSILIAWNASRESARAVADAMPLMERAESVEVLAVEPEGLGDTPGADIAAHLARHGIKVRANSTRGLDIDVGDVILNRVADSGADLVVMGAYGHSRMRELVLGGATRHILAHMTVPVLLSH